MNREIDYLRKAIEFSKYLFIGFRRVEIVGPARRPSVDDSIRFVVIRLVGHFTCSQKRVKEFVVSFVHWRLN